MDLITVFLLAIALCFDSFAVSLSCGLGCCQWKWSLVIRFALVLGFMQGFMTFIGWVMAVNIHSQIEKFDHWIAFGLLLILGIKMIYGSIIKKSKPQQEVSPNSMLNFGKSILLGIATSIDAVIAGVSLAFVVLSVVNGSGLLNMSISAFIIGIVTFFASLLGLWLGRGCRGGFSKLGDYSELIGGIVLILIGVKVLFEHLG